MFISHFFYLLEYLQGFNIIQDCGLNEALNMKHFAIEEVVIGEGMQSKLYETALSLAVTPCCAIVTMTTVCTFPYHSFQTLQPGTLKWYTIRADCLIFFYSAYVDHECFFMDAIGCLNFPQDE